MRKLPVVVLIAALIGFSCNTQKASNVPNVIPDDAFLVASFHPKKIYDKGQINTMESVMKEIDDDFFKSIAEDPAESGLKLTDYAYMFITLEEESVMIGVTAAIADLGKFEKLMDKLAEEADEEIETTDGLSFLTNDDEAAFGWNDNQMIFMADPEEDVEDWKAEIAPLFSLEKENSVTSIVDFKDFSGKMKDMNLWFTGDKMKELMEKTGAMDEIDFDFPMELYNNYQQMYVDFADGAVFVNGETHLSDDVEKAKEAMFMAKDKLNPALLTVAPGNDLLLGMAYSVDLDKITKFMKDMNISEMKGLDGQVEQATGVSGNEILEALNGDLVIAVNGAAEGSMIPVEVTIGLGLDDETLQDKLMGTIGNMGEVQEDGDFFTINIQGNELYSGIVDGIWVITNAKGYKEAMTGKGLEKSLKDSKFSDFTSGAMAFYMNLDISTYPAAIQGIVSQGGAPEALSLITESLSYMGMEASNMESDMILKTAKDNENSLYTLLQLAEKSAH